MAARKPTKKQVKTQPKHVLARTYALQPLKPSRSATPAVAPTWQWVVESGQPRYEPTMTTSDEPISMQKPREGVMTASLTPIARRIWYP